MDISALSTSDQTLFNTLLLISLLTLPLKGLALWKAARHDSKGWFVVLLAVNSLGILDIVYYFFVDAATRAKSVKR
jgi:hypothetical protein